MSFGADAPDFGTQRQGLGGHRVGNAAVPHLADITKELVSRIYGNGT
jgi:hypothetical protein